MTIATYADLLTAIGNWLGRSNDPIIAPIIPDWIALCEARLYRSLRIRAMEARVTATVSTPYVALPTDFLEMRNFQLDTSPVTALELVAPEYIDRIRAGSESGRPRVYAILNDEVQLAPAPDGAYDVEMTYWKRFDALAAAGTNWLLTNAPDVYLFGSLAEAAAYLGDDEHFGQWDARYQLAVKRLQDSDDRGRWSGSTPAARPAEITPA